MKRGLCVGVLLVMCLGMSDLPLAADLPEIAVSAEVSLVASPSHPDAYLPSDIIPMGGSVPLLATDHNGAWLLVLHQNTSGWIPSIFSSTGIARLSPVVVDQSLPGSCTKYLEAALSPDAIWTSSTRGSAIVQGLVYYAKPETGAGHASIVPVIDGSGWVSASQIDYVAVTNSDEIFVFTFTVQDLTPSSMIAFRATGLGRESAAFQAAFYRYDCTEGTPSPPTPTPAVPTRVVTVVSGRPTEDATGRTWTRPADQMVMAFVPRGELLMGSNNVVVERAFEQCRRYSKECKREWFEREQPQHTVALDAFWIDQNEVTNAQYGRCVAAGACAPSGSKDDHLFNGDAQPVVRVDWYSAQNYCQWSGARLPTEAEWEYTARGSEGRVYPWGDDFDGGRLNYCDFNCQYDWVAKNGIDGNKYTVQVRSHPSGASWCGALDLAGNVWEWVADWYGPYSSGRQVNPTGPDSGTLKVLRGGSWYDRADSLRGASRAWLRASDGLVNVGFRCAKNE